MTELTPGEITRALNRIEGQLGELRDEIRTGVVRGDLYDRDRVVTETRISAMEESLRWTRRTLIAAVIAFCVPALLAVLAIRGGG